MAAMLSPQEHYYEAERLLAKVEKHKVRRLTPEDHRLLLRAQVHATLAVEVMPEGP